MKNQTEAVAAGPSSDHAIAVAARPAVGAEGGKRQRLLDIYDACFEGIRADSDEMRRRSFQLRYQVYCVENRFEDPDDNPGEVETDEFDAQSVHCLLLHRPTGMVAGTVRLVLPSRDESEPSLPILGIGDHPLLSANNILPLRTTGEISRFSISKAFRRRLGDGQWGGERAEPAMDARRIIPHLTLGLMRSLFEVSIENGLTHVCALMEPTLLRLLLRHGICFNPVGPMVDFHGRRQPCYADIDAMLAELRDQRPEVWEVLTNDGRLRLAAEPFAKAR